jgi:hypothetical protein
MEAAEESWGGLPRRFAAEPIEVRWLVADGGSPEFPPPVVRAQGNLLMSVAGAGNFWCCDLRKGFGFGWVTGSVVRNVEYFRYHFLECMTLSLLDTLHVVSVHAACVELEGRGVLLAGESGAGKSSLAYACARRGWTYVSDDASSLVRRERGRMVVGSPRVIRLRAAAGALFPEFRGMPESRRGDGKPTIEVRTEALPAIRTAWQSHVEHVVFLNRRDGPSGSIGLMPVARDEALSRLYRMPWPADLPTNGEQRAALNRLLSAGVHEMLYRDLDSAVDRLEALVHGAPA